MVLLCYHNTWAYFHRPYHAVITGAPPILDCVSLHPECLVQFLAYYFCLRKCFLNERPNIYQFKQVLACKHNRDWGQENVVPFCHKVLTYCTFRHSDSWFLKKFFFQTLLWFSAPLPKESLGLKRTIMTLVVLSCLIFSLHQVWPIFIMQEMTDLMEGRKNQKMASSPESLQKSCLAFGGSHECMQYKGSAWCGHICTFFKRLNVI